MDSKLLKNEDIEKSFQLLDDGKIAKESIEIIFENIMAGKSQSTQDAMKNASIEAVNESDVEEIIKKIVENNQEIVEKRIDTTNVGLILIFPIIFSNNSI